MAKLELTLHGKKGFKRTVTEDYVSGQKLLDYWNLMIEIEEKMAELTPIDIFTKKVEFLASLFTSEKVTAKEIIQGVNSWELIETVERLLNKAMGAEGDDVKLESSLSETLESGI